MFPSPTHIIFDMDGVLLDTMPRWEHLAEDYLRNQGRTPEANLNQRLTAMSVEEASEYLRQAYQLKAQSADEITQGLYQLAEEFYRVPTPKPYATECVHILQQRGYHLNVATATYTRLARMAFRAMGILEAFDGIYCSSEIGIGKGTPEFYHRVLQRMGAQAKTTVMIEDSLFALQAAKAAGLMTIAVYDDFAKPLWEQAKQCATTSLQDLSQLPELF